jgi:hypothetical protein
MQRKPIDTAPRDGSVVRVLHGPEPQQEAMAYWSRSLQGWVTYAIESGLSTQQRVIHNVHWWLP